MSFCQKCGTQLVDEAQFCPSCGTPIGEAAKKIPHTDVAENLHNEQGERYDVVATAPDKVKNKKFNKIAYIILFATGILLLSCIIYFVQLNLLSKSESSSTSVSTKSLTTSPQSNIEENDNIGYGANTHYTFSDFWKVYEEEVTYLGEIDSDYKDVVSKYVEFIDPFTEISFYDSKTEGNIKGYSINSTLSQIEYAESFETYFFLDETNDKIYSIVINQPLDEINKMHTKFCVAAMCDTTYAQAEKLLLQISDSVDEMEEYECFVYNNIFFKYTKLDDGDLALQLYAVPNEFIENNDTIELTIS